MEKPKFRPVPQKKGGGLEPMHVEDVMQRNALAGLRKDLPPGGVPAHQRASIGQLPKEDKGWRGIDDGDLIASMAKRLSALEKNLKECAAQLSRSHSENEALKSKLRVAEEEIARRAVSAVDSPSPASMDAPALQHLRAENSRLRSQERQAWHQVSEIKQFLSEYGMIWVGDQRHQAEAAACAPSSLASALLPKPSAPVAKLDAVASSSTNAAANKPASSHANSRSHPENGADASSSDRGAKPVRSFGTNWSAGSAAHAEVREVAGRGTQAGPSGNGYGSLSGGGGLWSQPPQPKPSTGISSTVHANMQTPPEEEELVELAEAAAVGAAAAGQLPRREPEGGHGSSGGSSMQQGLLQLQEAQHGHSCKSKEGSRRSSSGGQGPSSSNSNSSHAAGERPSSGHGGGAESGLPFRLSDLLARVAELNQLAGDGCGQMVPGRGLPLGAVLQTPEPVRCTIFEDGLQLHRSPARPFGDPSVDMILRDMLDGFFPGLLKKEFPEGIPIKVLDRTRESYKGALAPVNPHAYSSNSSGSSNAANANNVHSFHDLESGEASPMNREKFLAKLPVSVIKNGKVVDIRGGIGGLMKGMGQGGAQAGKVTLVPSPADALLSRSQRNHVGPVLPPPSREVSAAKLHAAKPVSGTIVGDAGANKPEITTLQVKSEDGQQTMIVRLNYDDTIGALQKCINQHRSKQQGGTKAGAFEIRTAFPAKAYSDLTETLRSAGLVPNATLFLRTVQPSLSCI